MNAVGQWRDGTFGNKRESRRDCYEIALGSLALLRSLYTIYTAHTPAVCQDTRSLYDTSYCFVAELLKMIFERFRTKLILTDLRVYVTSLS